MLSRKSVINLWAVTKSRGRYLTYKDTKKCLLGSRSDENEREE